MPSNNIAVVGLRLEVRNLGGFRSNVAVARRSIGLFGSSVASMRASQRQAIATNQAFWRVIAQSNTPVQLAANTIATFVAFLKRNFIPSIIATFTPLRMMSQGILRLGGMITALGNQLASLGFRMTFVFSVMAVSAFGAAARAASSFETEMTKIITQVGVNTDQVAAWSQELLQLAPALGKLPVELAQALFVVTSAGARDSAQAMQILTSSAKASALGLGETKDIARTVTAVLQAYGERTIKAAKATDILLATVREGNLEAQKLAPTLGRVIGLAATLGVTFDEVGAFIATFTRAGVPAEVAVTSLRGALTAVIKPTKKAKDVLAEYGTSIQAVRDSIEKKGLSRTLVGLRQLFGENTEAMSALFGNVRGLSGVLFNTGQISEQFLEIQRKIVSSTGAVSQSFALVAKTTDFQWQQLRATLSVTAITLGNMLLPSINAIIQRLVPLIGGVTKFISMNPGLIMTVTAFALLVAVMGPLLVISGLLISSIGTIIGLFGTLATGITLLLTPIGLVVGALGVMVGLFAFSFRDIAAKAKGSETAIGQAVSGISDSISQMKRSISADSELASRAVADNLQEGGKRSVEEFAIAAKNVRATGDEEFGLTASDARSWGENIVISLAEGMANAAIAVVNVLISIGNTIASWLAPGSPPKLLPDLPEWGMSAMNEFLKGFTLADFSIFDDVSSIASDVFRSLSEDMIPEGGLVTIIMGSRNALSALIDEFRELGSLNLDLLSQVTGDFGSISSDVEDYVRALLDLSAATDKVTEAQAELDRISSEFDQSISSITDKLDSISDRRQQIKDDLRITELEDILASATENPLARELAQMEITEIQLRQQLRAREDARDAAEEQANANLEAAMAEEQAAQQAVALQEARIQAQVENNNLLQEHLDILERLNQEESSGGGGGAAGRAAGELEALSGALDNIASAGGLTPLSQLLGEGLQTAIDQTKGKIDTLAEQLKKPFEPLLGKGGLLEKLKKTWAKVFEELFLTKFGFLKLGGAILVAVLALTGLKAVGTFLLTTLLPGLASLLLKGIWIGFLKGAGAVLTFVAALSAPLLIALAAVIIAVGLLIKKYNGNGGLTAALNDAAEMLGFMSHTFEVIMIEAVRQAINLTKLAIAIYRRFSTKLQEIFLSIALRALVAFKAMKSIVTEQVRTLVDSIIEFFRNLWMTLVGASIIPDIVTGIISWFTTLLLAIVGEGGLIPSLVATIIEMVTNLSASLIGEEGLIPSLVNQAVEIFGLFVENLVGEDGVLTSLIKKIRTVFEDVTSEVLKVLTEWLPDATQEFFKGGSDLIQGLIDGALSMSEALASALLGLAQAAWDEVVSFFEFGSPSKLAMEAGKNIADSLGLGVTGQENALRSSISSAVSSASQPLVVQPPVGFSSGGGRSGEVVNHFGGNTINSPMDMAILEATINRVVSRQMRRF